MFAIAHKKDCKHFESILAFSKLLQLESTHWYKLTSFASYGACFSKLFQFETTYQSWQVLTGEYLPANKYDCSN